MRPATAVVALLVIILAAGTVHALEYEKKPDIIVSGVYVVNKELMRPISTNYLTRGDNQILTLVIFNDARQEKIVYSNSIEASFFSKNPNMLFTAYNVSLKLVGDKDIEVKTPNLYLPAIPPMKPINLQFVVKVNENAKPGRHVLTLKVKFFRIYGLTDVIPLPTQTIPTTYSVTTSGSNTTTTTTYKYSQLLQSFRIQYLEMTKDIPVVVYVTKKNVQVKILKVIPIDLRGKSKGELELVIKNAGEKTARNAYAVLTLPSGFEASSGSSQSSAMPSMPMMAGMAGMGSLPSMPTSMMNLQQVTAKSGQEVSYYIGDLKPNETAKVRFYFKINVKEGGNYTFHLKLVYLDAYGHTEESSSVPFGVYVAPAPKFTVKSVNSKLYVNSKGEVTVTIVSDTNLSDVTVTMSASSPLSVLSSEYYVGNVKAGQPFNATFKLQASSEAEPVTYPAQIKVKYKTLDTYMESDPIKIGVKVNPKMSFEVIGVPKIAAGEEKIIEFKIKNVGDFEVREATARLTIVDPFSSTDDTAYLGNLKPGQSAIAKFKVSVDKDATPKLYALNLEVKYKDPEGDWVISAPTKAVIDVTPAKPPYALYGAVIAIIVIAAIAYARSRR